MKQILLNKIRNREMIVGVVGLGYVGLPLAVEKAKAWSCEIYERNNE